MGKAKTEKQATDDAAQTETVTDTAVETVGETVAETSAETAGETVGETAYPEGHNGNNRRISAMLRESRRNVDMRAINRKLKMQVARLQGELKAEK